MGNEEIVGLHHLAIEKKKQNMLTKMYVELVQDSIYSTLAVPPKKYDVEVHAQKKVAFMCA